MRVVLDTNCVISGVLWSGTPASVLNKAVSGNVHAVTTEMMVDELRDVLQRPKFNKFLQRLNKDPDEIIAEYLTYTTVIEPIAVPKNAVRDVKDIKVIEAAVGGKAQAIVSGDDDLLALKTYHDIAILRPRDLILRLQSDNPHNP